jgi:hypothetical protein
VGPAAAGPASAFLDAASGAEAPSPAREREPLLLTPFPKVRVRRGTSSGPPTPAALPAFELAAAEPPGALGGAFGASAGAGPKIAAPLCRPFPAELMVAAERDGAPMEALESEAVQIAREQHRRGELTKAEVDMIVEADRRCSIIGRGGGGGGASPRDVVGSAAASASPGAPGGAARAGAPLAGVEAIPTPAEQTPRPAPPRLDRKDGVTPQGLGLRFVAVQGATQYEIQIGYRYVGGWRTAGGVSSLEAAEAEAKAEGEAAAAPADPAGGAPPAGVRKRPLRPTAIKVNRFLVRGHHLERGRQYKTRIRAFSRAGGWSEWSRASQSMHWNPPTQESAGPGGEPRGAGARAPAPARASAGALRSGSASARGLRSAAADRTPSARARSASDEGSFPTPGFPTPGFLRTQAESPAGARPGAEEGASEPSAPRTPADAAPAPNATRTPAEVLAEAEARAAAAAENGGAASDVSSDYSDFDDDAILDM